MSRQHADPYIVTLSTSQPLKLDHDEFNESWLKKFIFTHSEALPIAEIEPAFGPMIPVCRELRTQAGPLDILLVNSEGLLTIVECKLWEHPEARRAVIGQILDYAKELSGWSYEKLETAIKKARKGNGDSLYQLVAKFIANEGEELDEREFTDNVKRNLRRGRFLLLIVGSGIREGVERLTDFLQRHAHLNFTLALMEVPVFRLPKSVGGGHLILPRVIARTVEVERAVIRIEEGRIVAELPADKDTQTTISEQAFYEKLAKVDARTSHELRAFLDRAKKKDLVVEPGQNSLKLKFISDDFELNFGIFRANGDFWNMAIARVTEEIGHPEIGETYLTRLASLVKGYLKKAPHKGKWTVKKGANKWVKISDVLAVKDKWLKIIQDTIDQLLKAQETED